MKVLSEVEQLKVRKGELFEVLSEMTSDISKLENEIFNLQCRWVFVPENKIRRLQEVLKQKRKWKRLMGDYFDVIVTRYNELKPDEGPKGVLQNRVTISHEAQRQQQK